MPMPTHRPDLFRGLLSGLITMRANADQIIRLAYLNGFVITHERRVLTPRTHNNEIVEDVLSAATLESDWSLAGPNHD